MSRKIDSIFGHIYFVQNQLEKAMNDGWDILKIDTSLVNMQKHTKDGLPVAEDENGNTENIVAPFVTVLVCKEDE